MYFQVPLLVSEGVRKKASLKMGESRADLVNCFTVAALFKNEIQLTNYKFLTLFHAAYMSPRFLANLDIFQNKKGKKEL